MQHSRSLLSLKAVSHFVCAMPAVSADMMRSVLEATLRFQICKSVAGTLRVARASLIHALSAPDVRIRKRVMNERMTHSCAPGVCTLQRLSSCRLFPVQIGACMVLGTVVAILIVDRAGRRQLLIIGGVQMCIAEVVLTAHSAASCPAFWQTFLMHVNAWSGCIACF